MRLSFLFLLLLFSGLSLNAVQIWYVEPGATTEEIQQKINDAAPGDIIQFRKGTYTLNKTLVSGKSIILQGESTLASEVKLVVGGNFRHITAATGKMRLDNLTIQGMPGEESGGGIEYMGEDSLVILNCEFYSNSAREGGAVSSSGTLWVVNSHFTGNQSSLHGGAIYNKGKVLLNGCFFSQNTAADAGGALYVQSRFRSRVEPTTLGYSTFSRNTAARGGAVKTENNLVADECIFAENRAEKGAGGAILTLRTARVTASTFYHNYSVEAGGALSVNRNMSVRHSFFTGNISDGDGGAICNQSENIGNTEETNVIYASVFSENRAHSGGGVYTSFSTLLTDVYFERNRASSSGGGISGNKGILLDRACFEGNEAASEGGGVDASMVKIMNTTMTGNTAQHGSAVHAQADAVVVFSTFTGNATALKSGSVIYGNNVAVYGNIISGNQEQDKISGKIKSNDHNLIGKTNLQDIFATMDGNNTPVLQKEEGVIPVFLLKSGGEADNKIPSGHPQKWEKELGITEFFNKDQLGNIRNFGVSSDIGAVMSETDFNPHQLPVFHPEEMLATINNRTIRGVETPLLVTADLHSLSSGIESSYDKEESGMDPSPFLPVSSFDEDLDKIIDSIFSDAEMPEELPLATQVRNQAAVPVPAPLDDFFIPLSENKPLGGTYLVSAENTEEERSFASLEEAINTLNARGNSQEVRFVISSGLHIMKRQVTISNASFPVTLEGDNSGGEPVIFRARGNNRILVVAANIPIKMERIIFEGPDGETAGKNIKNGGGISCNTNALLTFENCIFRYNKNQMGGGIFARNVYLYQCVFYDNISSDGGGIYASECTAVNSTFYGNKAGVGAGIYAKDRATAVLCTFTQNDATGKNAALFAPAIHLYGCILTANKPKNEVEQGLASNFSNIFENVNPFNVFADVDEKGVVQLNKEGIMPAVHVKPAGVAAEQISESLLQQWEAELEIKGLMIDQEGKPRPQNRKAETGAWEIPDKRGI